MIHYDPVVTDDPELERVRALVETLLRVRDARLSVHDFRMVPGENSTNLVFDVSLPMELQGQEDSIHQALETALSELGETHYRMAITFDLL